MPSLVFVCTHNRFRSVIAEYVMRRLLAESMVADQWQVSSAGTWAQDGFGPTPELLQIGESMGLGLSGHRSRVVTEELLRAADFIIPMERGQKEALIQEFPWAQKKIHLFSQFCGKPAYDIPDPYLCAEDPEAIASEIANHLEGSFSNILTRE